MNKYLMMMLAVILVAGTSPMVFAGEHGGSEHGGKTHEQEHGGSEEKAKSTTAPSNDDIRSAMKDYVTAESKASGTFDVEDPDTGKTLNLSLVKVHERVGKTGDYYYSCADFKEVNTKEEYDLDLDVANKEGTLSVVDVRVHNVGGEPRYTYDADDNRIPLKDTKSHIGSIKGSKGSDHDKGSGKEHGGKEHGGN